jgi:hypothetical protein
MQYSLSYMLCNTSNNLSMSWSEHTDAKKASESSPLGIFLARERAGWWQRCITTNFSALLLHVDKAGTALDANGISLLHLANQSALP